MTIRLLSMNAVAREESREEGGTTAEPCSRILLLMVHRHLECPGESACKAL